ncbi:MAG: arginine--tRNA ligase [Pedobacter sp.]|uniref:arginine--tRNA ligase n=1 Tax=Pedobacter sp. TaxID=1411316 RepID=UPI00280974A4|nr:arginine--tRNA ligase [Pedobacter sp.]MDQ8003360.1 arginine--tRNA ligase [Pedobacter sp.]
MNFIIAGAVEAVKELYGQEIAENVINIQETRKEFEGQVTIVVFPIVRFSKKSPEETANDIGSFLQQNVAEVTGFNVVKGFLNLVIAESYWIDLFNNTLLQPDFLSIKPRGEKVMVEYSSPNTNKPLHLGHVRNNLLGYSVSELLKADGYEVIKVNLVNDRGIHICKSMLAWQNWGNGETPESSGLKGDHLVGKYYVLYDKKEKEELQNIISTYHEIGTTLSQFQKDKFGGAIGVLQTALDQNDPQALKRGFDIFASTVQNIINRFQSEENFDNIQEFVTLVNNSSFVSVAKMLQQWEQGDTEVVGLWEKMNGWVYEGFDVTYKKLGVDFDKYYYESNTYLLGKDTVEEGLAKGVFFKKEDGSVWIDLTADGLDQKLVLRADGTSVYITQDLGTAQMKYDDFGMDKSIYVVGNEQDYHFKVLFLILEKLGKSWAKGLYHLSYGMVDLPSGKMKSREGTVVDADDLVNEMVETAKQKTEELGKTNDFSEADKEDLYTTIGLGALKYFLLKVEPKKRLLFDPAESIDFQGNTGPFIQYTHARIKSLLSRADYHYAVADYSNIKLTPTELEMVMLLAKYPTEISEAAKAYSPAFIANYLYEVAKLFNKFYHETPPIIKEEDTAAKQHRLNLCKIAADVIKSGMGILGIKVPERM